jgi:hypothetical protein
MERFKLKERVEWLERVVYESSCRLIDCEEDINYCREAQRLAEKERLSAIHAEPAPAERRTPARSPGERRSEFCRSSRLLSRYIRASCS